MTVAAALAAAVVAAAGGLLVPAVVRRLPEPEPDPVLVEAEGPKPWYADLAAARGLAGGSALASAVAAGAIGAVLGWDWALVFLVPLVPVGVLLAFVDARTRLLPSRVVLPALAGVLVLAGVAALADGDPAAYLRALVAMVVVRSFFWLMWRIHSAGLGFGDVRLSAVLGVALGYLGWGPLVVGVYSSFLLLGVPGLALALVRRDRSLLRTAFPFGPAMLAGALLGVLAGAPLWAHLVGGGA
ncbi:MAG: prepilin peptidase [Nocardioides sp.]